MNKRKPTRLEPPRLPPILEVEKVTPPARYLGELQSNPEANIGDYYWNTGSTDLRVLTNIGWRGVA